jgi:hypothetical protein
MGSPFDKAKVDQWLAAVHTSSTDYPLLVAKLFFELTTPCYRGLELPVMQLGADYRAMSPWERNNALYGLRDLVNAAMAVEIAKTTAAARAADERPT